MDAFLKKIRQNDWLFAGLLLLVGAAVYLPLIQKLGYYLDDWFIIFDARTQGANFLKVVFSVDRPARGYLLSWAYSLFRDNLIYYELTSFLFRYLSCLVLYLTLNVFWQKRKEQNFLVVVLFLLFPAYIDQIHSVDMLPHSVSLCLAMVSIGLTILALKTQSRVLIITYWVFSVLAGWAYLGLAEHFIGFEFLRLIFIYYMIILREPGTTRQKVTRTVLRWLPYTTIAIGFSIWRVFIFNSNQYLLGNRAETDISTQLSIFLQSPLLTGTHWVIAWLYSIINTILVGWVSPFNMTVVNGSFRLRDELWILIMSLGVTVILLVGFRWLSQPARVINAEESQVDPEKSSWIAQAMLGGFLSVVIGLFPVIAANHSPQVESGGRFLLVAAPGAALMLVAGIELMRSKKLQIAIIAVIFFMSISTQYGTTIDHEYQTQAMDQFWWQVSWRVPQVEKGTTLLGYSDGVDAPEDSAIWGPANLIYYPQKQGIPVNLQLPAIIPSDEYIPEIQVGNNGFVRNMRGNINDVNFSTLLMMEKPDALSCMHIIDGKAPELSDDDPTNIIVLAKYSDPSSIILSSQHADPPTNIFGPEPPHTWCYYYERAALASQSGDWQTALNIVLEARQKGYKPLNRTEWLPFLQALVATRQIDKLKPYVSIMVEGAFLKPETCTILTNTAYQTQPADADLRAFIQNNFCTSK